MKSTRCIWLLLPILLLMGCREKQEGLKGCTDPAAENYDPGALVADSSSCKYADATETQLLWEEGKKGEWKGDEFLGVVNVSSCTGTLDTMTLNPNDTIDPGPFSLIATRDTATNDFGMVFTLTNERDMHEYENGTLEFDVIQYDRTIGDIVFKTYTHGFLCKPTKTPCENVCSSRPVNVSTHSLNDSTFRTISIPVSDYDKARYDNVDHIFAIQGNVQGGSDTILVVNDVKLKPKEE